MSAQVKFQQELNNDLTCPHCDGRYIEPLDVGSAECYDCGKEFMLCVDCGDVGYDDWELYEGTPLCCDCSSARTSETGAPQDWYRE